MPVSSVVQAVYSDCVPEGVEMWEMCCGGCSESPIPILTGAATVLKSALHIRLLSEISLTQRVPTANTTKISGCP